ncbi:hypothetical protein VTO42DRAFT_3771 [Malbranchea cinnamomea]
MKDNHLTSVPVLLKRRYTASFKPTFIIYCIFRMKEGRTALSKTPSSLDEQRNHMLPYPHPQLIINRQCDNSQSAPLGINTLSQEKHKMGSSAHGSSRVTTILVH